LTNPIPPTLVSITALARSGADGHAWRLFDQSGLADRRDDPAALALKARLLKDRALGLAGPERQRAAREAAEAYAAAAQLRPATYPLINAATLSLIAGCPADAQALARETLELLESNRGEPDTPYYLAATRAEALLLLGETGAAKAALEAAIAIAPRAWEDHASTLRQFAILLRELELDNAWLDACRPPRALHYAGQMRVADEAMLARRIDEILVQEKIGAGFGALAAGADLLIAERLLAHGAELHVTLPTDRTRFRHNSVDPYASNEARFEAVLAQATSIRELGEEGDSQLAGEMADEVAMGCAVIHARQLQSEAVQLIAGQISDGAPIANNSARLARRWADAGRRQHLIDTRCPPLGHEDSPARIDKLTAVLAVSVCYHSERCGIDTLAQRLLTIPSPTSLIAPPLWRSDGMVLYYTCARDALADAVRIRDALRAYASARIAGDFGVTRFMPAPFSKGLVPLGASGLRVERLLALTPPTAIYMSEYLATAWAAASGDGRAIELVGELSGTLPDQSLAIYAIGAGH
jgi:hypothetical protein